MSEKLKTIILEVLDDHTSQVSDDWSYGITNDQYDQVVKDIITKLSFKKELFIKHEGWTEVEPSLPIPSGVMGCRTIIELEE